MYLFHLFLDIIHMTGSESWCSILLLIYCIVESSDDCYTHRCYTNNLSQVLRSNFQKKNVRHKECVTFILSY